MGNMKNTITVITCKCVGDLTVYGDRFVDATFTNLEHAMALGESLRAKGKAVIVRPNYNERDAKGRYFREWRSFNGSPLKETRWEA